MDIKQLSKKPILGKYYKVPCVYVKMLKCWMPVLGQFHTDKPLGFSPEHIHIDYRFIPRNKVAYMLQERMNLPLGYTNLPSFLLPVRIKIKYRSRKCQRLDIPFPAPTKKRDGATFTNLWHKEQNRLLKKSCNLIDGHICPHRGTDLTSITPDKKNHVRCPAHGYKFNINTGKMIRQHKY